AWPVHERPEQRALLSRRAFSDTPGCRRQLQRPFRSWVVCPGEDGPGRISQVAMIVPSCVTTPTAQQHVALGHPEPYSTGGRIMSSPRNLTPRMVGTTLLAGLVFGAMVFVFFGAPSDNGSARGNAAAHHHGFATAEAAETPHGFTAGWFDGDTVQFFYTKDFFCEPPPTSGAPSQCEVGEDGTVDPRPGPKPTLYVMTP